LQLKAATALPGNVSSATPGLTTTPTTADAVPANNIIPLTTFTVPSNSADNSTATIELLIFASDGTTLLATAEILVRFTTGDWTTEKFVENESNIYEIMLPSSVTSNNGLFAQVSVADLLPGVYGYKISKSYPDGRVVTIEDTAEITAVDANQVAIFGSSTKANNTKFNDNWIINEPNTEFLEGTYVFEFTFNNVTRKYTVNVVERPSLEIETVNIGALTTQLFETFYTLKPTDFRAAPNGIGTQDLVIKFTQLSMAEATHMSLATTTDLSAGWTLSNLVDTKGEVDLEDLTELTLGTIANNQAAGQKLVLTITFWKEVDYSVDSSRFIQVGETQLLRIGFLAPLS
jgi:hypothetical protein